MIVIYKENRHAEIRLYALYSLIFFMFGLLVACNPSKKSEISIRWTDNRATGISIPKRLLQAMSADSLDKLLSVQLAGKETAIAGNYQSIGNSIVFEPLIPFTRGLTYGVWLKDNRLGEMTIPDLAPDDNPTLLAIYPTQDSLPDNLLKIYLHFSRPMREGQSQKYVSLVRNYTDTLPGVFLNLQPELWNADRTMLTLWLDPGRIKRDLQPNKRMGAPLQAGVHYQLVVSAAWPDQQGARLMKKIIKPFVTVPRDSLSPIPAQWRLSQPQSGSVSPLEVGFGEPLDYSLLAETLHILTESGKPVLGKWQAGNEEKQSSFKPNKAWKAGKYRLRIEGRQEDLAGNNINRPFDRDLTRKDHALTNYPFVEVPFEIR